jgi:hypothetical protein
MAHDPGRPDDQGECVEASAIPAEQPSSRILKGHGTEIMKRAAAIVLALGIMGTIESKVSSATTQAFGFNASLISGFPRGRALEMTGGGSFDLEGRFVKAGGNFRCLSDITFPGAFTGCAAGEGVRWEAAALLESTVFQCRIFDEVKTAFTGDKIAVLVSDFYRQGDGSVESFTAKMIVSDSDLDPVAPGVQNVWIQQIGCATDAVVSFN